MVVLPIAKAIHSTTHNSPPLICLPNWPIQTFGSAFIVACLAPTFLVVSPPVCVCAAGRTSHSSGDLSPHCVYRSISPHLSASIIISSGERATFSRLFSPFSPFLTISLCRAGQYLSHPVFSVLCHVFSQSVFLHVSLYVVPPSLSRSASAPSHRDL